MFYPRLGHTKDLKNGTQCLPAWHSASRVELGLSPCDILASSPGGVLYVSHEVGSCPMGLMALQCLLHYGLFICVIYSHIYELHNVCRPPACPPSVYSTDVTSQTGLDTEHHGYEQVKRCPKFRMRCRHGNSGILKRCPNLEIADITDTSTLLIRLGSALVLRLLLYIQPLKQCAHPRPRTSR